MALTDVVMQNIQNKHQKQMQQDAENAQKDILHAQMPWAKEPAKEKALQHVGVSVGKEAHPGLIGHLHNLIFGEPEQQQPTAPPPVQNTAAAHTLQQSQMAPVNTSTNLTQQRPDAMSSALGLGSPPNPIPGAASAAASHSLPATPTPASQAASLPMAPSPSSSSTAGNIPAEYPFLDPNRSALPYYTQEELARSEEAKKFLEYQGGRKLGQQRLSDIEAAGIKNLPDFMKAEILSGVSLPMAGMGSMATPTRIDASAADLSPDLLKQFGIDPAATPSVTVLRNKMTGEVAGIYPKFLGVGTATTPKGTQNLYSKNTGKIMAPVQGSVVPSMLPTISHGLKTITTMDANGNPVTQLVPVTTSSGKSATGIPSVPPPVSATVAPKAADAAAGTGAPFSPPPVRGGKSGCALMFPKTLTPGEHLKATEQLNQYNIAIDRAQSVAQRLPLLNSLLDAKKIDLQLDPHMGIIKAAINRNIPMTPEEEQLAGDFATLMEDINLVRGPMGATGFRGPEAFAALQAQRGQLLARPGITKQVLTNTIRALQGQADPLAHALNPRLPKAAPPTMTPPAEPPNMGVKTAVKVNGKWEFH